MGLNADGSIEYRGYTLMVSDIQVHVWQGEQFVEAISGEPGTALFRAKRVIDMWHEAR